MVLSSFGMSGGQLFNNDGNPSHPGATDSLSLGQLKSLVPTVPKPKVRQEVVVGKLSDVISH